MSRRKDIGDSAEEEKCNSKGEVDGEFAVFGCQRDSIPCRSFSLKFG